MLRRLALVLLVFAAVVGGVSGPVRADIAVPCGMTMDAGGDPCPQPCPAALCPASSFVAPAISGPTGIRLVVSAKRLLPPDSFVLGGHDPPPDYRPPIA